MKKTFIFSTMAMLATASTLCAEIPKGMTELVLEAHDAMSDGVTGFQWLLDSSHSTCGEWYYPGDFAYFSDYSIFDYSVPEGADKAGTILVFDGEASALVPAGTYDWMVTRTDGTGTYFPMGNPAQTDDFTFVEGMTYRIVISARDGEDGYGPYADLVVDKDVAITEIRVPFSGTALTSEEPVSVTITNLGTKDATDIPLSYSVNGITCATEIFPGTLKPGESADYTFTAHADLSLPGIYTISASVDMEGDMLPHNNSAEAMCRHLIPGDLPYEVQFSSLSTDSIEDEWIIINNSSDGSGWSFNEWASNMDGEFGVMWCQSPIFNTSDNWLITMPLYFHKGKGHVIFSVAAGNNENVGQMEVCVGKSLDPDGMKPYATYSFSSTEWSYKAINFDVEEDGVIYIGFHDISDCSAGSIMIGGVSIDEGEFIGKPKMNLSRTLTPFSNCDMPKENKIGIEVVNRGTGALDSYSLTAYVNDEKYVTEFNTPIHPDETRELYIDHPFDFSAIGKYDIEFILSGDDTDLQASTAVECFEPLELPLFILFAQNINTILWQPMQDGAWQYQPFFQEFFACRHGRENGLLSRGIAMQYPARIKMSFMGSDWDGTALGVYMGLSSDDPATYECVYTHPYVGIEEQKIEFIAPVDKPGNYSFVIADMGDPTSASFLKLGQMEITEVYPYDLAITNVGTDLAPFSPIAAVAGMHDFTVELQNRGFEVMENVTVSATIDDGVAMESEESITLLPEETGNVRLSLTLPEKQAGEQIKISFEVKGNNTDNRPYDNTYAMPAITSTEYTYAYENLTTPEYGVGDSMFPIALGNVYTLPVVSDLTGMTVGFSPATEEEMENALSEVRFAVYSLNDDMSIDRVLYAETRQRGMGGFTEVDVPDMRLAPGSYLFEVEQLSGHDMGLGYDPQRRNIAWQRTENMLTAIDAYALCIRANFGPDAETYASDVAVLTFTAPAYEEALYSDNTTVRTLVRNSGYEPAEFNMELQLDGAKVADRQLALAPYEETEVIFPGIDLSEEGSHTLKASAILDSDQNSRNNSLELTVITVKETNPYLMDFENCHDFDATGDPWNPGWTTFDRNGVDTDYFWAYSHPHRGEPCGFMAFNPDNTVPSMSETGFEAMAPHSGERFGLAFHFDSYGLGAEAFTQSDVWIISPKLPLGTDSEFELYVKGVFSSFDAKPEPYRILISESDDDPDSFKVIGDDIRETASEEWEQVIVDISEYDGKTVYVALQYLGRPRENTCLLIDDLHIKTNLNDSGTESIETEIPVIVKGHDISAPAGSRVYTADGIETGLTGLSSGVYIVKTPTRSVKVIIR